MIKASLIKNPNLIVKKKAWISVSLLIFFLSLMILILTLIVLKGL
jgi:hypothetical protein